MSSDAAPAAVPGPDNAASNPADGASNEAPKGLLDSLLTPISAARPATFNIDPLDPTVNELNQENAPEVAVQGATSATYNSDKNTPENSGKSGSNTRRETGVIRAWLLAGAERWRKGGEARLKALDIKKARAQAFKESRTVNRSEKIVGGSTGSGASSLNNTGKSLDSKTNNRPGKRDSMSGAKNPSTGSTKNASAGGSSTGKTHGDASEKAAHRTGPGVRAAARDRAADRIRNGPRDKASSGSKGAEDNGTGKGTGHGKDRASKGEGGSKSGTQGSAGNPSKDASTKNGSAPSGKVNLKKDPKPKTNGAHGKASDADAGRVTLGRAIGSELKNRRDNVGDRLNERRANPGPAVISRHKDAKDSKAAEKTPDDKKADPEKLDAGESVKKNAKDTTPDGAPKEPGKTPDSKSPGKPAKGPDAVKAKDTGGKPWTLQDSREAGYRDGARVGKATEHVKAYRDGVKDGVADQKEAAAREKTRLDQAHANRKQDRDKDQPVPGQASSADYHQPPQPTPIGVTGADATGIHLGDGAIRPSMSRGEVRTFVSFQQNLAGRTDVMIRVAERSKAYEAHAANQTKKISSLLEQAKAVKGGEKLVEKLTKLEEASKLQEAAAREVHRRAVRSAEGCKALFANTETRYGDIVRAAADSADGPADLKYYRDLGLTNA